MRSRASVTSLLVIGRRMHPPRGDGIKLPVLDEGVSSELSLKRGDGGMGGGGGAMSPLVISNFQQPVCIFCFQFCRSFDGVTLSVRSMSALLLSRVGFL